MKDTLAVFSEHIGPANFTHIRRHIYNLSPGNTVLITSGLPCCDAQHRLTECPTLLLNRIAPNNLVKAIAHRFRWQIEKDMMKYVLTRFFKMHKVKVMMGELLDRSLPWIEIAQELGVRFYGHAHGIDVSANMRDPYWQREYVKYKQSDGIITINQISKERLLYLGIPEHKIHVIPCGVDIPSTPLVRKDDKVVRCLAVGRMVSKKAPILTLDAFRRAVEYYPAMKLNYIGGGELLSAAEQYIQAFGLSGKVILHGEQPHEVVKQHLVESDIFIQHSRVDPATGDEEGVPVAVLEAMANSLPVVSTLHAGIPEAVVDGVTGYLVPEGNSIAMSERITKLAINMSLRHDLGEAGWKRARELFSWETERAKLLGVLGI